MTLDLARIRATAEACPQERWTANLMVYRQAVYAPTAVVAEVIEGERGRTIARAVTHHIALMDPPTTLALVEEVERLRAALQRLGSMEAFVQAGVADPEHRARIEFARAANAPATPTQETGT